MKWTRKYLCPDVVSIIHIWFHYISSLVPQHLDPPPLPTVHAPINSPLGLTPPFPLDRNKTISKQSSIIFSISYQGGKEQ